MAHFNENEILQALKENIDIADQVDNEGNTLLTQAIEFGSYPVFSYLYEHDKLTVPGQKPIQELLIHCPHAEIVYFCLYQDIISSSLLEFDFVRNSSFRYLFDIGMLLIYSENRDRAALMLDEILKYEDDIHIRAAKRFLGKNIHPTRPVKSDLMARLVEMYTEDNYNFQPIDYSLLRKDVRDKIKTFETIVIAKEENLDYLPLELRSLIYSYMRK